MEQMLNVKKKLLKLLRLKENNYFLCFIISLFFYVNNALANPDFSTLTQIYPEIKINALFDSNTSIYQGIPYVFQFKKKDLEDELLKILQEKAKVLNISDLNELKVQVIKVESVKWVILNFDGTKITINEQLPQLIRTTGTSGDIEVSELCYIFDTPTDPMDESMIVCSVTYEWNAFYGTNLLPGWPKIQEAYGKYVFKVLDFEPPHNIKITPNLLYSTCGDKISEFNNIISRENLTSKYSLNPNEITVIIIDDNPFGAENIIGKHHSLENIDGFILIETYNEKYRQFDYNMQDKNKPVDPFDLDSTIYECLDNSYVNNGKLTWFKPIKISDIKGISIKSLKLNNKVMPNDNVAYVISIPIIELENTIEQQIDKTASKMPLHYASMSLFTPIDPNSALEYKSRSNKALRLTFALCDSSLNWLLPSTNIINDNATYNELIDLISNLMTAKISNFNGNLKYNVHNEFCNIYVFDNKRPNPLIVMTNTETNNTDIFTVANSDLSSNPYENNQAVWEFDYNGASETMQRLPNSERERFKKALTISEDVRLIFKILAYDNINKSIVYQNITFSHGISTPVVLSNKNDYSTLRYVTWKINDPACENKNLISELIDGTSFFVYPEYIFRNPDSNKSQSVEFIVHDTSLFYNPPQNIDENIDYNSSNTINNCNQRKIKLCFNILPRAVSVSNMGAETKSQNKTNENK